jgi:hypothetical protein
MNGHVGFDNVIFLCATLGETRHQLQGCQSDGAGTVIKSMFEINITSEVVGSIPW